jgi:TolA-binding protein
MVGLGDTKKKIQTMIDTAEETYKRLNELRQQVQELRDRVEATSDTVEHMQYDLAEQRALLEALADQQGLDAEQVIADAHIDVAEPDTEGGESTTESDAADTGETGGAAGGPAAEPED